MTATEAFGRPSWHRLHVAYNRNELYTYDVVRTSKVRKYVRSRLNFKVVDVDLIMERKEMLHVIQQAKKGAYHINYNHIKLQSYSLRYLIWYFYPFLQSLHMQLQNTNAFGNLIRSEAAQWLWHVAASVWRWNKDHVIQLGTSIINSVLRSAALDRFIILDSSTLVIWLDSLFLSKLYSQVDDWSTELNTFIF